MDARLAELASDSGSLLGVTGLTICEGRFRIVRLEFHLGVVELRCNDNTDEIVAEASSVTDRAYPSIDRGVFAGLRGMRIEYAWCLTNQRGYFDAFQLRLTNDAGLEQTRQFEVSASAMDVTRVVS